MSLCECDDYWLGFQAGEFGSAEWSMIEIPGQPARRRESQQGERGCDHPPAHPEIAVPLPDVVEEGGPDQVQPLRLPIDDHFGTCQGVPLIYRLLPPEGGSLTVPEPTRDPLLLGGVEGPGPERLEQTPGEMEEAFHQIIHPAIRRVQSQMNERAPSNMKRRAKRRMNPYCENR